MTRVLLCLTAVLVGCSTPPTHPSRPYDLAGTWEGSAGGVAVTFALGPTFCPELCNAVGSGTFVDHTTGSTGRFSQVSALFWGLPDTTVTLNFFATLPGDSSGIVQLSLFTGALSPATVKPTTMTGRLEPGNTKLVRDTTAIAFVRQP